MTKFANTRCKFLFFGHLNKFTVIVTVTVKTGHCVIDSWVLCSLRLDVTVSPHHCTCDRDSNIAHERRDCIGCTINPCNYLS
jgi:hypothetical protein